MHGFTCNQLRLKTFPNIIQLKFNSNSVRSSIRDWQKTKPISLSRSREKKNRTPTAWLRVLITVIKVSVLLYTSTCEIPTLFHTWSLKKVPLSGGASVWNFQKAWFYMSVRMTCCRSKHHNKLLRILWTWRIRLKVTHRGLFSQFLLFVSGRKIEKGHWD